MSLPEAFPELLTVLEKIVTVLDEHGADYALIGGLGLAMRGPVRATRDIDLLLSIPQMRLPGLLEELAQAGFSLDVLQAIAVWNRDHLLNFSFGSIRVDWLQPVLTPAAKLQAPSLIFCCAPSTAQVGRIFSGHASCHWIESGVFDEDESR